MYCRRLNAAVHEFIGQSREPLVLACVHSLFIQFQQISTYPHLASEPIVGNPDRLSLSELHDAAQSIVDSETQQEIAKAVTEYTDLQHTQQASADAETIAEAACKGRISTVFVANDAEIWGTPDRSTSAIKLAVGNESPERDEFLNRIAIQTVMHGGIAYTLPLASMPCRKPIAALFRY